MQNDGLNPLKIIARKLLFFILLGSRYILFGLSGKIIRAQKPKKANNYATQ